MGQFSFFDADKRLVAIPACLFARIPCPRGSTLCGSETGGRLRIVHLVSVGIRAARTSSGRSTILNPHFDEPKKAAR